ncbi:monovalent cation/H(+) antiporter subunit G [Nocardia asteroides]|uniref:Na(+)/H(+) antiporter subunit G n=2 Tax=Nocardia asteroides TaxID=1824 RepID=U5EE96_NOCAS|nr:monovalent cation/H(+) antiporter subunit G [Nocardia asteroides]TLF69476.1 monovalent cation/H(+) antiporter subunit G [Nocardia asteroides NBRC 15531]UGT48977.1 monovalent cation/H(+) antiporter subunit G [Nocardia asteroides]SFL76489.1 multisubunit sodium/proton antiporter, MrpG subunit [Nocardia asteroides]VEG31251.1 Multiple resistance and pH homeostasis protein G [Nocardia asteroides]GAD83529.1 Na(+)/H(+) antiporter subunit G [Nocardia asteroides NBRC 15531]
MSGWEWVSAVLILTGCTLAFTASIGIVRFPDTLTRMHAATKPQVVGLVLVMIGAGIDIRNDVNVWMLVLTGLFTILTAPVIAHLIGRTAYREQRHRDGLLRINELGGDADD